MDFTGKNINFDEHVMLLGDVLALELWVGIPYSVLSIIISSHSLGVLLSQSLTSFPLSHAMDTESRGEIGGSAFLSSQGGGD